MNLIIKKNNNINMKKFILVGLIIINLIMSGLLLKDVNNNDNPFLDVLKQENTKDICLQKNEIFRDSNYIYYFSCNQLENIFIELRGVKYSLNDILNENIYTFEELVNLGLNISKEEIGEESDGSTKPDTVPSDNEDNNSNKEDNSSNEEENNKDEVILSLEEIQNYNKTIKRKTSSIYDLNKVLSYTAKDINNLILKYNLPKLPKYNGNVTLTESNTKVILENRNLENINVNNIQKGIIVKRANLRSFPSNVHFYDKLNKEAFDRLQETELHVNTEVVILHESKDNMWYFVVSEIYAGWVYKENVALVTDDDIEYFQNSRDFGIIIVPKVNVLDTFLDMSVKLPLKNNNLVMPVKGEDGFIKRVEINLDKSKYSVGYLAYTKENVIKNAKSYEGFKYSWGGMDDGVDCSSYIANIYRTFGFIFPRNTADQSISVGRITDLSEQSNQNKLNIMEKTEPSLLYQNGHVMLYLGKVNNKYLVIEASGVGKVVVTELTVNGNYLKKINKLVEIK